MKPLEGRTCTQCGLYRLAHCFSWQDRKSRLTSRCKDCRRANHKENPEAARRRSNEYYWANREVIREKNRERYEQYITRTLWQGARYRAKKKGIPFAIDIADVVIPEKCPILGITLAISKETVDDNSPTLDRIIPSLGYIKGNVIVISHRANSIKQNATAEELFKVANFVESVAVTALAKESA